MNVQPGLSVSIIVPVHADANGFVECLAGLLQAASWPHELIVVADGPAPEAIHLARQFGAKLVELPDNGGPARARNRGAAVAEGDILFFVDSDVVVPADIVEQVVAAFEQYPQMSALIGSYDDQPAAPNFLSQYRNLLHHYTHQTSADNLTTFWAGCGAVRRSAFTAVGGFDELFAYPSIEDIEFGYRLAGAGHKIRIVKSLQVTHLKQWRLPTMIATDFWQRALPWTRLLLQREQFENNLNVDRNGRFSVALLFLLLLQLPLLLVWPMMVGPVGIVVLSLLVINRHFYRFLYGKRGLAFTLASVPWHWFYFFYSGLAFALGSGQHYTLLLRQHVVTLWQLALQSNESAIPVGEKSAQ
jgi:glycosyltransferase involved in cell wall biosynthesis